MQGGGILCLERAGRAFARIVPKDPAASLEGYDLEEVYCLCCSWHGTPKRLVKY